MFNKRGKIQIINLLTEKIEKSTILLNKNFVSQTENEENNLRRLKFCSIENDILCVYDETIYQEKYLQSSLRFYKINFHFLNNTENEFLTQICCANNPHQSELISLNKIDNLFVSIGRESCDFNLFDHFLSPV